MSQLSNNMKHANLKMQLKDHIVEPALFKEIAVWFCFEKEDSQQDVCVDFSKQKKWCGKKTSP